MRIVQWNVNSEMPGDEYQACLCCRIYVSTAFSAQLSCISSAQLCHLSSALSAQLCQLQQRRCPQQMSNLQTKTSSYMCISSLVHQAQKHRVYARGLSRYPPKSEGAVCRCRPVPFGGAALPLPPRIASCHCDLEGLCPILNRPWAGEAACLAGLAQRMLQTGHNCNNMCQRNAWQLSSA